MLPPITRADPSVPPKICLFQSSVPPLWVNNLTRRRVALGLWRGASCFVRNTHSKEIPTSSTIFRLLFKIRAAFVKNPNESRFQVKQVPPPPPHSRNRISEHLAAWLWGSCDNISLQQDRTNRFSPTLPAILSCYQVLVHIYF
jgi:hypothetical protein